MAAAVAAAAALLAGATWCMASQPAAMPRAVWCSLQQIRMCWPKGVQVGELCSADRPANNHVHFAALSVIPMAFLHTERARGTREARSRGVRSRTDTDANFTLLTSRRMECSNTHECSNTVPLTARSKAWCCDCQGVMISNSGVRLAWLPTKVKVCQPTHLLCAVRSKDRRHYAWRWPAHGKHARRRQELAMQCDARKGPLSATLAVQAALAHCNP